MSALPFENDGANPPPASQEIVVGPLRCYVSRRDPQHVIVLVAGEIDIATAPAFEREVMTAVIAQARIVSVDLSAVTFMDSSGLGVLLRARQLAADRGSECRLVSVPPIVRRVIDSTGVAGTLGLVPS